MNEPDNRNYPAERPGCQGFLFRRIGCGPTVLEILIWIVLVFGGVWMNYPSGNASRTFTTVDSRVPAEKRN